MTKSSYAKYQQSRGETSYSLHSVSRFLLWSPTVQNTDIIKNAFTCKDVVVIQAVEGVYRKKKKKN